MKALRHIAIACGLAVLAAASTARAQRFARPPHLGYAWPAGTQQGQTVEIILGGQFLGDANSVLVSGDGVSGEIVDYYRPPTQREIGKVRRFIQKTRKELLAEIQSGGFAREWVLENQAGQPRFKALRRRAADHDIEKVGERLRAMMPWIAEGRLVEESGD